MNYNITAEEIYREEMEREEAREELKQWFEEHPEERED